MNSERYLAWLCLKNTPELGLAATLELLKQYPQPENFVGQPAHPLYKQGILKAAAIEHLKHFHLPPDKERILKLMAEYQIRYHAYPDADYPPQLREIFAPPLILYVRGDLAKALSHRRLAVVGTRTQSVQLAEKLSSTVAKNLEMDRTAVSGVNLDEEAARLLQYQQAYQASSKVIQIAQSLFDSVLNAVGR